jgi:RND family efflux transporter MFP subunit
MLRIGLALLALGCSERSASDSGDAAPVAAAAIRVRGVAAKKARIEAGAALVGRLEPYERATLAVRLAGTIREMGVDVGDRVRAGQLLARLTVPGLSAQAAGAVAASEAAKRETEMREDVAGRTATIAQKNRAAISEQEVVTARNEVATAQARATSASAEARRLRELVSDTRVVAPFDGIVVARPKDRGTSVSAGDVVLEVARVDQLRIRLEIPEAQAGSVRLGAPVVATLPTLGGRRIEATVTRFAPALDARTRMLPAEIDVPNPDGALVGGVRAEVRLKNQTREGVLVIPSEALLHEGSETVVYVMESGVARRRVVRPGYDNGLTAEIQEGVAEGDVVLVGGRGLLRDGVGVEVAQ